MSSPVNRNAEGAEDQRGRPLHPDEVAHHANGQRDAGDDEAVAICLCTYARTDPEALRRAQKRPRWLAEAALAYPAEADHA